MNPLRRCAAAIACACLLSGVPLVAAAGPLDKYSEAQLSRWLHDEIDDIFSSMDPDTEYTLDELEHAILEELGDDLEAVHASPAHRAAHEVVTLAALEQEMHEAGTSLEAVVHAAVLEADRVAGLRRPRLLAFGGASDGVRSDATSDDPVLLAMANGKTPAKRAADEAVRGIVRTAKSR